MSDAVAQQERAKIISARERARRAALHRQIGALERVLAEAPKPRSLREWVQRRRLELKVRRLRGELAQLSLLP